MSKLVERLRTEARLSRGQGDYIMANHARLMDEAAEALGTLCEELILFRDYGCPACSGDCSSANPPVMHCPMKVAADALQSEIDRIEVMR